MQYSDRVVDVPAAVHRQGLDVPVILQRQVRADSRRVPQIQLLKFEVAWS